MNCSFFEESDNPFSGPSSSYKYKKTSTDKHLDKYLHGLKPPMECPAELNKCREVSKRNCANYFTSPKFLAKVGKYAKCDASSFNDLFKVARNTNKSYKYNRKNNNGGRNENNQNFGK